MLVIPLILLFVLFAVVDSVWGREWYRSPKWIDSWLFQHQMIEHIKDHCNYIATGGRLYAWSKPSKPNPNRIIYTDCEPTIFDSYYKGHPNELD